MLKTGPGEQTAERVLLVCSSSLGLNALADNGFMGQFANEPSLDFSDVQDKSPTQEFEVAVSRDVCEYSVK